MPASAAIARMVARSKPDRAKRSLAAARITALVSADDLRMPTSVCQQVLTLAIHGRIVMPTSVGNRRRCTMNSTYDTDILVVGAGPTGLTLATALVARGIATAVVDRQAAGANTSRAAVV